MPGVGDIADLPDRRPLDLREDPLAPVGLGPIGDRVGYGCAHPYASVANSAADPSTESRRSGLRAAGRHLVPAPAAPGAGLRRRFLRRFVRQVRPRPGRGLGMVDDPQALPRQPLDSGERTPLRRRAQRDRHPAGAGARGAADAVDIALGLAWEVEIDDVADA